MDTISSVAVNKLAIEIRDAEWEAIAKAASIQDQKRNRIYRELRESWIDDHPLSSYFDLAANRLNNESH